MKYALLSTWKMSLGGIRLVQTMLQEDRASLADALCAAVRSVEDDPSFHSVGYGGYPNREGDVQLDAAYMDGSTFHFGGVAGAQNIKNPIDVAYALSRSTTDCFLCGEGVEAYARKNGYALGNMLSKQAHDHWLCTASQHPEGGTRKAYAGHDTVCVLGKQADDLAVAVSTSGLFMKAPGRIGDSPVIGSGFYADSRIGSAAATGAGEDIMRGCLSFDVVRQMEAGLPPQEACERILYGHVDRMERAGVSVGSISVIAMDAAGAIGVATTFSEFAFVFADQNHHASVCFATYHAGSLHIEAAGAAEHADYRFD